MYSHIQLDESGAFLRRIPAMVNIEWDENNLCTVDALVRDGKDARFRVVPFYTTSQPTFDPLTETAQEIDPVLIHGIWTQQWATRPLTDDELAVARKALVPQSVAMWQARSVLIDAGLLDDVEAFIAAIPDPVQQKKAKAKWEYSNTVQRNDALLNALAPALGLDEAAIDQLFITAASL